MSFRTIFAYLVGLLLLNTTLWAQQSPATLNATVCAQLKTELCKMAADNASNVSQSGQSEQAKAAENAKRQQFYANNFNRLLSITRQYGFPSSKNWGKYLADRSSSTDLDNATATILTQVAQSQAQAYLLFETNTVALFADEIKKGNLKRELLNKAMYYYSSISKPCETDKYIVSEAINAWQLGYNINDIPFQACW
jgi:hypothetical protein